MRLQMLIVIKVCQRQLQISIYFGLMSRQAYPEFATKALKSLFTFLIPYMCKAAFHAARAVKMRSWNRPGTSCMLRASVSPVTSHWDLLSTGRQLGCPTDSALQKMSSTLLVCGKIFFHETSPWHQNVGDH